MNILLSKTSRKYLARCGRKTRVIIAEAIEGLPDKGDIRRLKGRIIKNTYRLRIGRYRVIYVWEADQIRILDINTRGDIY